MKFIHSFVYIYNMYVLFFRFLGSEWKFGSMGSVMNVSKLTLAETSPEVFLSSVVHHSKGKWAHH